MRAGDEAAVPVAGIEQSQGRGGAVDGGGADFIGMGESGGLAGDAAQAEARRAIIVGMLQPAVVEPESLADPVLQIELAIVMAGEMAAGEPLRVVGIEAAIKEGARIAHAPLTLVSAGPPSRTKRRSQ